MATKTSPPRPATGARSDGVLQPVVGFVAGSVALAVGIGYGVPQLDAGRGAGIVTGIASTVAGCLLIGTATVILVRRVRGWWRLVLVPVLVAFVLVALMSLGQAVAATYVPRQAIGSSTPARSGLTYTDVVFRTSDGAELSGWYIPSTNGAAIAMLHGAGATRSDVLDQAVVLARHGYGVLLFDARGHGRSGGRAMDFGWYGDQDVGAAVSYLESRPDVEPARIGVLGLSMGGEEAIGAAARDSRIRAVVAEGATNRTTADRAWLSDRYGWRGTLQEGVEWLTYQATDVLTRAGEPISLRDAVAAAAPRPVLLITAGTRPDEKYADDYIRSGSPDTVQVWVVPGSGHTAGLRTDPAQWEQRVGTFFDGALLARSAQ